MVIRRENVQDAVYNRGREIQTADPYRSTGSPDEKEFKEREEAAQRYAGENEKHFVDYLMACLDESHQSTKEIRKVQDVCWRVYNEVEPTSYLQKEPWQSRVIVPKPYQTVQFGAAAVKKAFSPNFLSVSRCSDKGDEFWQKVLDHYFSPDKGKFVQRFGDATVMAFGVGQGMEIIPRFIPGKGLWFSLVAPWKIARDPDAQSRQPQSGMYWIHTEWLDHFVLKDGENNGRYFDVDRVKDVTADLSGGDPFLSKEAVAKRKQMVWKRSNFRTMIQTHEFAGMVLSPRGEVLLDKAMYTVAGGRVIQLPTDIASKRRRFPGTSFTALPNLLRFGGRGLLEGVVTLWEAMSEIMNLHLDLLKWVVNPPKEINTDALVDPTDLVDTPGKKWIVQDTLNGQHAVRAVESKSRTNEVLASMQYYDQNYQRGAFVTDAVQGLPGYRKDITFREAAMNLDQAMGVFGLMGEALEEGAIDTIDAAVDVIEQNIGYADLLEIFQPDELRKYGIEPNEKAPRGVTGIPPFDGKLGISGLQALMRDNEVMKVIREMIIPLSDNPRYAPYIEPYPILKAIEVRSKLTDEKIIVTDDQAKIIQLQQRLMMVKENEAAEALAKLQEALGIADLIKKLQEIDEMDIRQGAQEIMMMQNLLQSSQSAPADNAIPSQGV